jgi:hypothetical protein
MYSPEDIRGEFWVIAKFIVKPEKEEIVRDALEPIVKSSKSDDEPGTLQCDDLCSLLLFLDSKEAS